MLELNKSWNDALLVKDCLLKSEDSGTAPIIMSNASLSTQVLKKGTYLGKAARVDLIRTDADENNINTEESEEKFSVLNYQTYSNERLCWRKQELKNQLQSVSTSLSVSAEEMKQLYDILGEFHDIFSLDDDERGETSLVEFNIDTGDSPPIKQAARRVPYAARHEIATQLSKMQDGGVIQPSKSSWASPVVLVRKCDGSLRFCVDYRTLNSVVAPDW